MSNLSSNNYVHRKTISQRKLFGFSRCPESRHLAKNRVPATLTNPFPFKKLCLDAGLHLSCMNLIERSPAQ
jgi:hypothetical protein